MHLTIVDQDATNIPFYLTVPCSYSNAFDALCKHFNVSYIISGSVRNTQKQKQTSFVQHKPSATERRVKSCMHKVVSMISLSSNSNSKALSDVGSLSFIVLLPSDAISSTIEVKSWFTSKIAVVSSAASARDTNMNKICSHVLMIQIDLNRIRKRWNKINLRKTSVWAKHVKLDEKSTDFFFPAMPHVESSTEGPMVQWWKPRTDTIQSTYVNLSWTDNGPLISKFDWWASHRITQCPLAWYVHYAAQVSNGGVTSQICSSCPSRRCAHGWKST